MKVENIIIFEFVSSFSLVTLQIKKVERLAYWKASFLCKYEYIIQYYAYGLLFNCMIQS